MASWKDIAKKGNEVTNTIVDNDNKKIKILEKKR